MTSDTAKIAVAFSVLLRQWLTPDEMTKVIRRNAMEPPASGVCHSHDFCDANEAMDVAFRSVVGRSIDGDNEADCRLWNDAWELALYNNFRPTLDLTWDY